MSDWDQLLQESEDLAFRDAEGFPQVDRDLLQVEELSQKLRTKASRLDQAEDGIAASRLLAQQGVNVRRYNRDLLELELRPTHEDVFQSQPSTVDEYLQQVHESTVVTAIQEAQRQTDDTFQQFMADSLQVNWQRAKRRLLDSMLPSGGQVGMAQSLSATTTAVSQPASHLQNNADQQSSGQKVVLSGRFKAYAEATARLNASHVSGQPFDAVAEFAKACIDEDADSGMTMRTCWQLLCGIAQEAAAHGSGQGTSGATSAMLKGAQQYLEKGHVAYMQRAIQADRAQAALGGDPSRAGQLKAFLRVKNQDVAATMDFDSPAGVDTTWQRVFCALRSGYTQEALEVARNSAAVTAARPGGKDFAGYLSEWLRGGGSLPAASAAALAPEVDRLLREARAQRGRQPFFGQRAALHVLLVGDRHLAEQLQREVKGLFPTIEDYMWFQLALVRSGGGGGGGPEGDSPRTRAPGAVQPASLDALQHYLQQYPPAHYSHQGKEPLLYTMVQLLSLQLQGAVAYLARDPATRAFRVDAVHLGLALHAAKLLDAGQPSGGGQEGMDIGAYVHLYGREFVHTDVRLALEYYLAAARVQGDTPAVRGKLLRELLTESRAYGFLLGSGGTDSDAGALAAYVPDRGARRALISAIADECAAAAQTEEAVELYMYAGGPRPALHLLNHQLSDLLEPALDDRVAGERAVAVVQRAAAAVAAMKGSIEREDLHQMETFSQLKTIRTLLQAHARGEAAAVAQQLLELPFVPLEAGRLRMCSAQAQHLHPALLDRLPRVLSAAADALAAQRRPDALRTVVAFADSLPAHVPQSIYRELNRALNRTLT